MIKHYRVDIPVKPHIRKFLHCQHGFPLQINHRNPLGTILLALLESKNVTGLSQAQRERRRKRLTATVECFAAIHHAKRSGIQVSDEQIININRLLEAEFEKELYLYVKYNTGPKGRYPGYMEALRGFMDEYHICEKVDMPLDSLKKKEYRYRKELERNKVQSRPLSWQNIFE